MYIYTIKRKNTDQNYIGQTIENPQKHWACYRSSLRRGNFHNPYLQNAWDKYGEKSYKFEIINDSSKSLDQLNELEAKYIIERGYYNIMPGGNNTSAESRRVISELTKKAMTPDVCKKISRKAREGYANGRISYRKGKKFSCPSICGRNNPSKRPEVRMKMSKNHANVSGSKNPMWEKSHTEDSCRKISEHRKGKCVGEDNYNTKLTTEDVVKIRNLYIGGQNRSKIGKSFGISRQQVWRICTGKTWNHI